MQELFIWDGKHKRQAKKITCFGCGEEWLIRKDRDHSGLCRRCKFKGSNNPMFGKPSHNKGKYKHGKSWTKYIRDERKKKIVLMMGNRCNRCGEKNMPISCYTTHHVEPETKVFSVMSKLNEGSFDKNWPIWEQEIKKCVLLCHNCHNIIHYGEERAE